jgi:hypothetical protein
MCATKNCKPDPDFPCKQYYENYGQGMCKFANVPPECPNRCGICNEGGNTVVPDEKPTKPNEVEVEVAEGGGRKAEMGVTLLANMILICFLMLRY